MQLYVSNVFTTGIMNKWAMSTMEDNSENPRVPSLVRAWIESSKHGQDEKSRNTINMHLDREKSMIIHRSSNVSHPGENVACAQPSVSHKLSKHPSEDLEEDDRKRAAKRIKMEPEDEAQSWAQDEQKVETTFKLWEDKKDYEAIFRKYISIREDGEEHYDVIDMERESQRAVRKIQDHQEIVKQYQKVVRAYNNL